MIFLKFYDSDSNSCKSFSNVNTISPYKNNNSFSNLSDSLSTDLNQTLVISVIKFDIFFNKFYLLIASC